jgi:hypothetical protein
VNRNELVEALESDDGLLADPVVIRTVRPMLPNYSYDFTVEIKDGYVYLKPTEIQHVDNSTLPR